MSFDFQIDAARFSRFFQAGSEPAAQKIIAGLFDDLAAAETVLVTTVDGHRVLSAIGSNATANPQRLAAIIGSLCGLGETLVRESGHKEFRDVSIVSEASVSVVRRLPEPGQRLIVLVTVGPGTTPGMVGTHARHVAQMLARHCLVKPL